VSLPDGAVFPNTIHESLGIRVVEATPDRVVLEMDVTPAVHQPLGLLHGGASAVMAESAASIGAYLNCGPGESSVGTDLNISHLRARRDGVVRATAVPVRKGRTMHVWTVDIVDGDGVAVAVARCTLVIVRADPRDSQGERKD
jgi:1,4-dihydroxy-2-naphthoyl-CoA hydrolase